MKTTDSYGSFTFVLHTHLPYVISHGKWPHGMVWLSEAASESYIPLWRVFNNLHQHGIKLPLTLGITPVLAEQLSDPSFAGEFLDYLKMKKEAAEADLLQFEREDEPKYAEIARFWIEYYRRLEEDFRGALNQNIIQGFKRLQDEGALEIITCAATHGYLPLLGTDEAVEAQVRVGVESYRRHFGCDPRGIWLPECAYRPGYHWISPSEPNSKGFNRLGLERILQKYNLRFFVVDAHLLKGGKAIGAYLDRFEGLKRLWEQANGKRDMVCRKEDLKKSPHRLHWVAGSTEEGAPVSILTRDEKTSLLVWSGEYGYPGDGNYLDFHKKRFPGGHRYWKVTRAKADLGDKLIYEMEKVQTRLNENSDHFVATIAEELAEEKDVPPGQRVVVSPFDTELFGHWWFEGPHWLEQVFQKIHDHPQIKIATGSQLVEQMGEAPIVELPEGSWGEGGFHYIWFNQDTRWTWGPIHEAEKTMTRLARQLPNLEGWAKKIFTQLGRELLLLESSDWQFLISTAAARDYAEMRFRQHRLDFNFLKDLLNKVIAEQIVEESEMEHYRKICERDSLFEELDPYIWAGEE